MDPKAAAAALIDLNRRELEPLYTGFSAGSLFGEVFGARIGAFTGTASEAGRAYVRASGIWFASASELLQKNADAAGVWDELGIWIDKTVRQRAEIMAAGVGLADPISAATQGFVDELARRIKLIWATASNIIPPVGVGIGVLLALVVAVLILK